MCIRISCVLLAFQTLTLTAQVDLDARFTIKNAGVSVAGYFGKGQVDYVFSEEGYARASFSAVIDVTSIDTRIKGRDRHLMKPKYFDSVRYPTMHFTSTGVSKTAAGYLVKGRLTIKATTREVEIPFDMVEENGQRFLKGHFELDRRDYGVGKNHLILGNAVKVYLTAPYTH